MKTVKTQVDEATLAKIHRSGISNYQFLKEAIALKLKNDEALSVEAVLEDLIEKKFKTLEQRVKENSQQLVEQSFGAVLEVFHEIKKDFGDAENKHNTFRDNLRVTIQNIFEAVKKQ